MSKNQPALQASPRIPAGRTTSTSQNAKRARIMSARAERKKEEAKRSIEAKGAIALLVAKENNRRSRLDSMRR